MERTIYSDLLRWKDSSERKPLLLEGVRQCGKTYILKEFGRREYRSVAYVDLEKRIDLHALFDGDLSPTRIVNGLKMALGRRIEEGGTLIIIDEAQTCPRAITSMKYFHDDAPGYHIVFAGSLLGILTARTESFPVGMIDRLRMYPMTFSEFLNACGEVALCEHIRSGTMDSPVDPAFHQRLVSYLREYYMVGGMPEVVGSWVENHSIAAVTRKLRTIVRDYRDDFAKHAGDQLPRLTEIWDSIPVQLARENNRFVFSHVKEGGRARDLSDAVQWLVDAGLVHKVCAVGSPATPLKGVCDRSHFKLYLCDIGILRVMSGRQAYFDRSDDAMDRFFKWSLTENHVLCQMLAAGLEEAFFWRDGREEVDFLIDGSRGPVPIEVKSEDPGGHGSLDAYMDRYRPESAAILSMDPRDGGRAHGIPLYCAEFVPDFVSSGLEGTRRSVSAKPYREFFEPDDWEHGPDGWILSIPRSRHGVSDPGDVQVYREDPEGFVRTDGMAEVTPRGVVVIRGPEPFRGFASISSGDPGDLRSP